jgi:hypothetical protein
MWEEDPRWQQAQYRLFLIIAGVFVVGANLYALWQWDWEVFLQLWIAIGAWLAMLAGYALIARLVGEVCRRVCGRSDRPPDATLPTDDTGESERTGC